MRQILDLLSRARQRITTKVAAASALTVVGGVGSWLGYGYFTGDAKPKEPTKQVLTGVQPAAALLADDQLPAQSPAAYQPTEYSPAPATAPPSAAFQPNPYASAPVDPNAGGASPSAAMNPYAEADAPTTAPPAPDAGPPAEGNPPNPYRPAGDGALPYEAPSASYAATDAPPPTPVATSPVATAPPTDPGLSPYGSAPAELAPVATAPPAVASPPAAAPAPLRSLGEPAGLSPYAPAAAAAGAAAVVSARATATPGERQHEGPQQPTVTIEKFSPAEIQVGKPATFEMLVRNAGQVPATNVVVTDHVPAGTQLVDVKPQPAQGADGSLVWQFGTLQPGDEQQITLQVMPQTEGEIGSTAHVSFAAQATSRSICTRPQLTVEHAAPAKVLIGQALTMVITVSNPGSGPATGVIIEEDVPPGLSHVAGAQLEYEVGTLRPGESKRLELALRAEKAGIAENTILVRGDAGLSANHKVAIEVVAPQLEVEVNGPKKRFLERQATYTLSIANPGTAAARDVELAAFLPRGMKFVNTDSQGQYDPAQHAVFWSLEELPPAKAGSVKLTTLPIEPGEQKLRVEGRADLGLSVAGEQSVQVEQSAELLHAVKDADEVIEVGSETTYEIRVSNTGTKAATNVRIVALLPAEMKGLAGEGPTRAAGDASRIVFEPLARLNPREEVVFKVQVQGIAPGDHIVRVQLSSDEWPTPVTREESTRVYEDR
ncbi:MAG: hypothetical protein SFU86_00960 [Pirellulaceae bacterium]|nr:hypothetical protein [Pirellulaceae bacterium]